MAAIGHGTEICTSTTRPASPAKGMQVFETDTNKIMVCSNATGPVWKEISDLDSTDGLSETGQIKLDSAVNGSDYQTGQIIITTALDTNFASVTVTATGRPIIIMWSCHIYNLNSGASRSCDVQLFKGTTGLNSTGPSYAIANNDNRFYGSHYIDPTPTAGSITYNLRAKCDTASACGIRTRRLDVFES